MINFNKNFRLKSQEILGNYQISNYLTYLKKAQFFDEERIEDNQTKKLKKIIQYAVQNIKFYSDFFKENKLKPSDINELDDLTKLPIITKEIYRKNFPNNLVNRSIPRKNYVLTHTSGSTASPIDIYTSHALRGRYAAESIFFFEWAGKKYGEPYVRIWGKESKRIWLFNTFIKNAFVINAKKLSNETINNLHRNLMRKRFRFLEAFTSSANALASLLKKYNLEMSIPTTIVSGETLFDFQRERIMEQLNTQIYNRYGCRECGDIAQECSEHQGLHVLQESFIIEILDDNNEPVKIGEKGKIIITHLDNYLCPLIRYQIDDIGALSPVNCTCGRKWQMLKYVEGRISDIIYSPSGRHISLFFFIKMFEKLVFNAVNEYQVLQPKHSPELVLRIVPGNHYSQKIEHKIINEIKSLDKTFKITIEKVKNIPLESSGKKKLIKLI